MTIRYVTADWLDRPDIPSHAFEGVVTGYWNGFAEWMTTRPVIEKIAAFTASHPDAKELPSFRFEGDALILSDDGEPFARFTERPVAPDQEGLYPMTFGMVWSDRLDPERTYAIHRMDGSEGVGRLMTTFVESDIPRYLTALVARDEWGDADIRARADLWLWENAID